MKRWILQTILLRKIKLKRLDLYAKAKSLGRKDHRVITCSQELDALLNKYQSLL
ncbi:aspartyl-phosphate phosphatase Spo0E family protein [Paenisporosarcina quisquiliarum]|uniref:aspartyl-phosphate phosphatase Spo0E family protein n=1 Tax=Paenisporosarcina quisquiliarum TaxID=365346 RepID=UPI003736FF7D